MEVELEELQLLVELLEVVGELLGVGEVVGQGGDGGLEAA